MREFSISLTTYFASAIAIGLAVGFGLRFTSLVNLHGQRVLIPNRNISVISRFRGGCFRAYVDIQLPSGADESAISERLGFMPALSMAAAISATRNFCGARVELQGFFKNQEVIDAHHAI